MAELLTAVSYSTSTTPYSEGKNLYENIFDDDLTTFADYNGADASITMTFSEYAHISKVEYSARNDDWASRIIGGTIEGSNDGSYWITLHTISAYTLGEITSVEIDSKGAYKYIRFSCQHLNCSLLRLYGEERDAPAFDGWNTDSGSLTNSKFPELPQAMSQPYPDALWRVGDGKLRTALMPDIQQVGAFCHCGELERVSIPDSVKKIGRYAFTNTALKSVKLADDCEYYATSFPDGCEITGGPWMALRDVNDLLIADNSGKQIYVRRSG